MWGFYFFCFKYKVIVDQQGWVIFSRKTGIGKILEAYQTKHRMWNYLPDKQTE